MKKQEVTVKISNGLDVSPIALLVQIATKFKSEVFLDEEEKHVNAKSIMGMMTLRLNEGKRLIVAANGADEDVAVEEMVRFLSNK